MNEPLPASGLERQIMLNALQAYREACQPPELTPSCPFFTWTANGPACGEQCADLLAIHGIDDAEESVDVGSGIVLVRQPSALRPRRPRRGPGSLDRPWDAAAMYSEDSDRPHADRRTVALVQELHNLLVVPPPYVRDKTEHEYDLGEVRRQLSSRGFDVDSFIRFGLGREIALNIAIYSALPIVQSDADVKKIIEKIDIRSDPEDGWSEFLETCYRYDTSAPDSESMPKVAYVFTGFTHHIGEWAETAALDDILTWRSPTRSGWVPPARPDVADGERETALWLCDRFLGTYESDWELSSLHLEWLYLHSRLQAPCSVTAMAERKVDVVKVSMAIAETATDRWRERASDDYESRSSEFANIAIGHLRNDRPELAATIYEALTSINPSDAEAMNNYGFCLIPSDSESAVNVLTKANQLYKNGRLLTIVNLALALHLTGRNDDSYAIATSGAARELPSQRAWLWSLEADDRIQLTTETIDIRDYMASLVRHLDRCRTASNGACPLRARRSFGS